MPENPASVPASGRRLQVALGVAAAAVLTALVGLYGVGRLKQPAGDAACTAAVEVAKKIAPLAQGEVAAVTMASTPLRLPDLAFEDVDGRPRKLSDWRGKTVLLNLWATWCVPCRKEMPALDELQGKLGGKDFEVVAVNIDTRGLEKPRNFLKEASLTRLGFFNDQKAKSFQDLKNAGRAVGMPTSVLVDAQGCEIGTISGPAEWASEDAIKLIKAAARPAAAGY